MSLFLRYSNHVAALIGGTLILDSLHADWWGFIGLGVLIGWLVEERR